MRKPVGRTLVRAGLSATGKLTPLINVSKARQSENVPTLALRIMEDL